MMLLMLHLAICTSPGGWIDVIQSIVEFFACRCTVICLPVKMRALHAFHTYNKSFLHQQGLSYPDAMAHPNRQTLKPEWRTSALLQAVLLSEPLGLCFPVLC